MFTRLKDFASALVAVVEPETTVLVVSQLMHTHRLRRLILVNDAGQLSGIVSMEDVLELLTRELANLATAVLGARDREFEQRQ